MEAKDKAKALVDKFLPFMHPFHDVVALKQAKQCALIACSEVLKVLEDKWTELDCWTDELSEQIKYYKDVENEINQL